MAERAAHLVDHVFPRVPVRQWVLSLPHRLRYRLAWDHALMVDGVFAKSGTVSWGHARRGGRSSFSSTLDGTTDAMDSDPAADVHPEAADPRPERNYPWSDLMRRSMGIDVLVCPRCGGRLRLIALIDDPAVIRQVLRHLGLPTEVPEALPAARHRCASSVTRL